MKRFVAVIAILALALASCGGDGGADTANGGNGGNGVSAGDAAAGEDIFSSTCSACHGPDARGIEGLGRDLHSNTFVDGLSDDELVDFLVEGRPADHPDNEAGVAMPPRGGNPSLTADDLQDVVAYLRTLD